VATPFPTLHISHFTGGLSLQTTRQPDCRPSTALLNMSTGTRPAKFDMRIAVIGYSSSGKTSMLSAMFYDTKDEIFEYTGMKHYNYLQLLPPSNGTKKVKRDGYGSDSDASVSTYTTEYMDEYEPIDTDDPDEVCKGDSCRPGMRKNMIKLQLKKEICKMHPNGQFTFIDTPGLDKAGTKNMDMV
jgi:GTPase SAR1 family protein